MLRRGYRFVQGWFKINVSHNLVRAMVGLLLCTVIFSFYTFPNHYAIQHARADNVNATEKRTWLRYVVKIGLQERKWTGHAFVIDGRINHFSGFEHTGHARQVKQSRCEGERSQVCSRNTHAQHRKRLDQLFNPVSYANRISDVTM